MIEDSPSLHSYMYGPILAVRICTLCQYLVGWGKVVLAFKMIISQPFLKPCCSTQVLSLNLVESTLTKILCTLGNILCNTYMSDVCPCHRN